MFLLPTEKGGVVRCMVALIQGVQPERVRYKVDVNWPLPSFPQNLPKSTDPYPLPGNGWW